MAKRPLYPEPPEGENFGAAIIAIVISLVLIVATLAAHFMDWL